MATEEKQEYCRYIVSVLLLLLLSHKTRGCTKVLPRLVEGPREMGKLR